MRPLPDMQTIQIEVTNACHNSCANCTRLCGHYEKVYFMEFEQFKQAVDSLSDLPQHCLAGMMGGEPLLHPEFEKFCEYMRSKIKKEQCGLWTCLPKGKEHYRDAIVATFGNIFINDHTRDDILHSPVLVPSVELDIDEWQRDYLIDKCWVQNTWSASINPSGAWFCEVAAALAMLLGYQELAWPVEEGWWLKSPKDFINQMELCKYCGCAMPLRKRYSVEETDDISETIYDYLKNTSPKIKAGKYVLHDGELCNEDQGQLATYKAIDYRDMIAKRYGMFLMLNEKRYMTPYLMRKFPKGEDTNEVAL